MHWIAPSEKDTDNPALAMTEAQLAAFANKWRYQTK